MTKEKLVLILGDIVLIVLELCAENKYFIEFNYITQLKTHGHLWQCTAIFYTSKDRLGLIFLDLAIFAVRAVV